MKNKFDELAKNMAQSVTRRAALKKFGVGLSAIALAMLGLAKNEPAQNNGNERGGTGNCNRCQYPYGCSDNACINKCAAKCLGGGF